MNPLVSIILPTYNRANLLPRAITSVFAQSHLNWELIIISDHCTDTTREVIGSFSSDQRIKHIELNANVGGAEARNIGMQLAQGEYIAFLDDDDEWLPEKLRLQLRIFYQSDDAAIVSCNYFLMNGLRELVIRRPERITLDDLLYFNVCGSFSFCMIRKEYVTSLSIDTRLKACQDWDLWVKIMKVGKRSCIVQQNCLVRYHEHDNARLTTDKKGYYHSYIFFIRNHYASMNTCQKNYNLAYAAFYKNCTVHNHAYRKCKLLYKSYLHGIRSRRISVAGYISFVIIPYMADGTGWARFEKWLYYIGYRYFKWLT